MSARVGAALAPWLLALLVGGCGNEPSTGLQVTPVPACADITRFGNGLRCDGDAGLGACGVGPAGLCASGWLCFDAPTLAFCSCATDTDCQGRASYINTARAARKIAPMPARCGGGRCVGTP